MAREKSQNDRKQVQIAKVLPSGQSRGGREGEAEFFANAFGADAGKVGGVLLDGGLGCRVYGEIESGGEADGAQQAQVVFAEAIGGVADGAEDFVIEVVPAADEVEEAVIDGVEEEAIDGEVAAFGVFLGGGELNFGGSSAIEIDAVVAEGGDFDDAWANADEDDAERLTDGLGVAEEGPNLRRQGVGGNVVILGFQAKQQVAHAAAGKIGYVARIAQGADDGKGIAAMAGGLGAGIAVIHENKDIGFSNRLKPRRGSRIGFCSGVSSVMRTLMQSSLNRTSEDHAIEAMRKVLRIGSVSYLNAKPLIHGLGNAPDVDLKLEVPSRLLAGLREKRFDIALLPVIDYQRLEGLCIVPSGGIGCDGPTLTVRIFSKKPIERIQLLACDTDSHTSVALARVILAERYGVRPAFVDLVKSDGPPADAVLLIGDKVVCEEPPGFDHQLDLGYAWKELTGLPFVFAIWTAREGVDLGDLPARLEVARRDGLEHVGELIQRYAIPRGWPAGMALQYLTVYLNFGIGERQLAAIRLFHEKAGRLGLIGSPVRGLRMYSGGMMGEPTRR